MEWKLKFVCVIISLLQKLFLFPDLLAYNQAFTHVNKITAN